VKVQLGRPSFHRLVRRARAGPGGSAGAVGDPRFSHRLDLVP